MTNILATAKAWAALVGAILTALVGTLTPDDAGYRALTIALAVVTAVAVYGVPNKDPKGEHQDGSVQPPDERGAGVVEYAFGLVLVVVALYVLLRLLG